jgi:hypothetical protein
MCAGEAWGHGPAGQRARVAGGVIGGSAGWRAAICCARGCAGSKSQVAFRSRGGAAVRRPDGRLRRSRVPSACHGDLRPDPGTARSCISPGSGAQLLHARVWRRGRRRLVPVGAAWPELPGGESGRPGGGHGFGVLAARGRSCSCWRGRHRPGAGPACLDQPRAAAMSRPLRRGQRSRPGQAGRGVPAAACGPGNSGGTGRGRGDGAADGGLKNPGSSGCDGSMRRPP